MNLFITLVFSKNDPSSGHTWHSSLGQESAQLKYQKSYPKQTKANFRFIGTKSSHRDNKIKIYRDFFRDSGPNRSKVGPNGQISSFEATDFIFAQNKGFTKLSIDLYSKFAIFTIKVLIWPNIWAKWAQLGQIFSF